MLQLVAVLEPGVFMGLSSLSSLDLSNQKLKGIDEILLTFITIIIIIIIIMTTTIIINISSVIVIIKFLVW